MRFAVSAAIRATALMLIVAAGAACSSDDGTPTTVITPPDTIPDTTKTTPIDPRSMTLTFISGPPTIDTIQALPVERLVLRVTDPSGKTVANQYVNFVTLPGINGVLVRANTDNEFFSGTSAKTDSAGYVSVSIRMSTFAGGLSTVRATIPTNPNAVSVSYISTVGGLARAVVTPADAAVVQGGSLQLVTTSTADRFGNARADTLTFSTTGNRLTVTSAGLVTGLSGGSQNVAYKNGAFRDSIPVLVMPRGHLVWEDASKLFEGDIGSAATGPVAAGFTPTDFGTGFVYARADGIVLRDGNGAETVLNVTGAGWPDVSADGAWIYFTKGAGTLNHVRRIRTDGTGIEDLTPTWAGGYPTVSPDGKKVAFIAPLQVLDLATMKADTISKAVSNCSPKWSPDGQWIAFVQGKTAECQPGPLLIVHPDGTGARQLGTKTDWNAGISWSPDMKWLALSRANHISIMEFATGASHDLEWTGSWPAWIR